MRYGLRELAELSRLKRVAGKTNGDLNTNKLEDDFLKFCESMPERTLTVHVPKLYNLKGKERENYKEALEKLEIDCGVPDKIDISGASDYLSMDACVAFVSSQQLRADHIWGGRSYLDNLLGEIYSSRLLKDFTIHESVCGKVKCKRGDLDLKEIALFPEKFFAGPYELEVELDTPNNTVERFAKLQNELEEFRLMSKKSILNPEKVSAAAKEGIELRKIIGSLSRYQKSDNNFHVQTYSCFLREEKSSLFYLYAPARNQNIMVYFGENPFENVMPRNITIIKGEDYQKALTKLVEMGIYEPSADILDKRLKDLEDIQDSVTRGTRKIVKGEHFDFEKLIYSLKEAKNYFREVANPEMRQRYTAKLPPSIIEFMVYPRSDDPIIHELLPRISWNGPVRKYHNTREFMSEFGEADDEGKREILKEVQSNLMFSNQQNNNVNLWLYQNHKQFCLDEGLQFQIT